MFLLPHCDEIQLAGTFTHFGCVSFCDSHGCTPRLPHGPQRLRFHENILCFNLFQLVFKSNAKDALEK